MSNNGTNPDERQVQERGSPVQIQERHAQEPDRDAQEIVEAPSDTVDSPRLHTKMTAPEENDVASAVLHYTHQSTKSPASNI